MSLDTLTTSCRVRQFVSEMMAIAFKAPRITAIALGFLTLLVPLQIALRDLHGLTVRPGPSSVCANPSGRIGCKRFRATNVVDMVGIAAIDQDIARLQMQQEVGDGLGHDRRRHHQPYGARLRQRFYEVCKRRRAGRLLLGELLGVLSLCLSAAKSGFRADPPHCCYKAAAFMMRP
jgi:hypothetical protein